MTEPQREIQKTGKHRNKDIAIALADILMCLISSSECLYSISALNS